MLQSVSKALLHEHVLELLLGAPQSDYGLSRLHVRKCWVKRHGGQTECSKSLVERQAITSWQPMSGATY